MDQAGSIGARNEVWPVISRVVRRAGGDEEVAKVEGCSCEADENLVRAWDGDWGGSLTEIMN